MEDNKKTQNSKKKSFQKKKEVPLSEDNSIDTTNHKINSDENKNCSRIITQEEKRRKYWQGYREPLVVATLLLFIATGFLYYEASNSGNDAKRAADIAKATLTEYEKEFEDINRPDVAIVNFRVSQMAGTPYVNCAYDIINTGKSRAMLNNVDFLETIMYFDSTKPLYSRDTIPIKKELLQYNAQLNVDNPITFNVTQKNDFFTGKMYIIDDYKYQYYSEIFDKNYIEHVVFKIYYSLGQLVTEKLTIEEKTQTFWKDENK